MMLVYQVKQIGLKWQSFMQIGARNFMMRWYHIWMKWFDFKYRLYLTRTIINTIINSPWEQSNKKNTILYNDIEKYNLVKLCKVFGNIYKNR